jgi:HK97 family phage prohead protease
MEYEIRSYGTLELRADDDSPATLVGVAPAWETLSTPGAVWGVDREKFARGSISNLGDDILVTIEHDNARILGRTGAGTATLTDTPEGLRYEVELGDTTDDLDLIKRIKRGDVNGSSFEFFAEEEELDTVDGESIRTVTSAVLRQVGPVARPAFGDAPKVSLRCAEKVKALKAPVEPDPGKAERARQLREAELALAESSLKA